MEPIQNDIAEGPGWLQRNKFILAGVAVAGSVLAVVFGGNSKKSKQTKPPVMQMVAIALPPPPPPPPPPPRREPEPTPMQQEQMMIPQETVTEADAKPDETPAPVDSALGTGIKGNGAADGFGLGTSGSGGRIGGIAGGTGAGGSRWGWYAGQVQSGIQTALSSNPRTRALALDTRVRIWLDANGRVERVEVPSADAAADVITAMREALVGLQMRESAPGGMPMPIVLRISARRPS